MDELEKFFAILWDMFIDSAATMDGCDLQEAIEESGLGYWHEATEQDIGENSDYSVGDPIIGLTEAGKAAVKIGKKVN